MAPATARSLSAQSSSWVSCSRPPQASRNSARSQRSWAALPAAAAAERTRASWPASGASKPWAAALTASGPPEASTRRACSRAFRALAEGKLGAWPTRKPAAAFRLSSPNRSAPRSAASACWHSAAPAAALGESRRWRLADCSAQAAALRRAATSPVRRASSSQTTEDSTSRWARSVTPMRPAATSAAPPSEVRSFRSSSSRSEASPLARPSRGLSGAKNRLSSRPISNIAPAPSPSLCHAGTATQGRASTEQGQRQN